MGISAVERLRRFYEQFSGDDYVLIVINADPDAIASAMAVKRLLWRKVAQVAIAHVNIINRPDNLAMVRLLGVAMAHTKEVKADRFTRFVMVDSQPNHHESFAVFPFCAVIDHHPETGISPPFVDIRPRYGATASMMTEYLRAAGIKPSVKLATALFYAIKTDTSNFERQALMEDVRAFQFLFRHANMHLARRIEQADLRMDFLRYFKVAIEKKRVRRGRLFVHLDQVSNPDICVIIADFFMRVNTINWTIVSGIYRQKLVVIIRNDGLRKNAGNMAKSSFAAFGSAGGHKSVARAELDLAGLPPMENSGNGKNGYERWIIKQVEKSAGKR